jgi:hypothetical protein
MLRIVIASMGRAYRPREARLRRNLQVLGTQGYGAARRCFLRTRCIGVNVTAAVVMVLVDISMWGRFPRRKTDVCCSDVNVFLTAC